MILEQNLGFGADVFGRTGYSWIIRGSSDISQVRLTFLSLLIN